MSHKRAKLIRKLKQTKLLLLMDAKTARHVYEIDLDCPRAERRRRIKEMEKFL